MSWLYQPIPQVVSPTIRASVEWTGSVEIVAVSNIVDVPRLTLRSKSELRGEANFAPQNGLILKSRPDIYGQSHIIVNGTVIVFTSPAIITYFTIFDSFIQSEETY